MCILNNNIVALVPCYNVAQYCGPVVQELNSLCTHVIVVDDGSTDETETLLQKMASEYPQKTHLIRFPKNRGKGFALLEGFKYALAHFDFDVLATLDGDGQHLPCFITNLVQPIFQGADLVIGGRTFKKMPFCSRFGNKIIGFLLKCIYHKAPHDTQSGMRAYTSDLIREIVKSIPGGQYEMEFQCLLLALERGLEIIDVPIPTIYIEKNQSSHFRRLSDSFKILKELLLHLVRKK